MIFFVSSTFFYEWSELGSLSSILFHESNIISAGAVLHWSSDICEALHFIHHQIPKMHLIHFNLRLDSILACSDPQTGEIVCKLSDFTYAQPYLRKDGQFKIKNAPNLGSLSSVAPEIIENGKITYKSDLYSLGLLIWSMIHRRYPFQAKQQLNVMTFDGGMQKNVPDYYRVIHLKCQI